MTNIQKYGKGYWNKINSKIKRHHYRDTMNEYKKHCYNEIIKELNIDKDSERILITDLFDEAFDSGNMFRKYYFTNAITVGIDISNFITEKVQRKYPKSNIICCDTRKLPFKNDCFDLIISPSSLDHFPKENLVQSIKELKRTIKKNGKLIISLHNKSNIWLHFYLIKLMNPSLYEYYLYNKKDILDIFRKLNLKVFYINTICHLPIPIITTRLMNLLRLFNLKQRARIFSVIERFRFLRSKFFTGELILAVVGK